jgi:hypothetical protein
MEDPRRSGETEGDAPKGPAGGAAKPRSRWGLFLAIVIVVALLGLIVYLHLTGALGPGTH